MIHFENILKTFCFFSKTTTGSILAGARYPYHSEPMSILIRLLISV